MSTRDEIILRNLIKLKNDLMYYEFNIEKLS